MVEYIHRTRDIDATHNGTNAFSFGGTWTAGPRKASTPNQAKQVHPKRLARRNDPVPLTPQTAEKIHQTQIHLPDSK